jgi:hypothetical protein
LIVLKAEERRRNIGQKRYMEAFHPSTHPSEGAMMAEEEYDKLYILWT